MWSVFVPLLFCLTISFASKNVGGNKLDLKEDPKILTSNGMVEGKLVTGRNGRTFAFFEGIPFADMPQRYQAPTQHSNWTGILLAKEPGAICPQFEVESEQFIDHNDNCLFLNVYVSSPSPGHSKSKGNLSDAGIFAQNLPVMVYIHGGSYYYGAGSFQGPTYLMSHSDVLLVTLNYRLGNFGFLSLGEETTEDLVTENNGLRDMIMGLKWVRENIFEFGGDPGRVTIFGESAGASSVGALILSPEAKGLFSGAISESGAMFCPWAVNTDPKAMTRKLATRLNCEGVDPWDPSVVAQCLKGQSVRALLEAEYELTKIGLITFAPTIDLRSSTPVLPDTPYNLLMNYENNSAAVPYIIGYNEKEGLINALEDIVNLEAVAELNNNWTGMLPDKLGLPFAFSGVNQSIEIAAAIQEFYMAGSSLSNETLDSYTNIYSDFLMNWCTRHSAILHAGRGAKVFPYRFTYRGNFSLSNSYGMPSATAVTHEDELQYLFTSKTNPLYWPDLEEGSEDAAFGKQFIEMWTSFATTGTPTSWGEQWNPIPEAGVENVDWLNIKKLPTVEGETQDFVQRVKFWDELFLASKLEREFK